jgi:succinate dehydrogenase / fumarate reductase cytochrome b subunit
MTTLRVPLEGSLYYRGREGQWAYLLHRITGLGTLLFLTVHILDTSTVYFFPDLYQHAIAIYRSTPFMLGEIALVFAVIYHGVNGLRIALFDLFPSWWQTERQRLSFWWVVGLSVLLWLPAAFLMGRSLVENNFLGG